ncbi:signal peptidase II [Acetobacterium wieringae]|uniref:Signal peptidase II n=1 Tax=Acetobacterium wieringae TaxID=52694 RepID=A0ABY6HL52_9FIRM|nr:signal peptidase II [Acetobacterium wieringae]UYO64303.1 signal peptidase II [Acetobacterium wieringae]VUZ27027.1 Lipoprotein signal peptidase [Acetobacterium wieringae]
MKNLKYLMILFLLIGIDLATKIIIEQTRFIFEIIINIISISYIENGDTCPAILTGDYSSLVLVGCKTIMLILVLLIVFRSNGYGMIKLGLVLMLAGNLGNLINILTYDGKAIDWIVLGNYLAINLADVYLLVGICMIAYQLISWLFAGCLTKNIKLITSH